MDELWCLHVYGPDDLIAAPSKDEAEAKAAELRRFLGQFQPVNDENMPKIRIEVERWPHSAASHASELAKWVPAQRLDA